ncbi:MAG: radical SAM protein [Thermoprotei archaeon]|nr:MAG: radical SAM protein [Thermoprotei archaeon]
MDTFIIVDGYTDEPAGLGVPPYLDVYPRYVAGAIWSVIPSARVLYFTIDEVRAKFDEFLGLAQKARVVIVIAGVAVPGKYLGGTPITLSELELLSRIIEKPIKILGGPVAMFGIGSEGGRVAELPDRLKEDYDLVVKGDIELAVYELLVNNYSLEKVSTEITRRDYRLINTFARRGAKIVMQHPNYSRNLIVEIETFRGCPRYIVGGCSFCIEPLYGSVVFRPIEDILLEIEALYSFGVDCFRIGRQTDLYSYMAKDVGKEEFPKPNPQAIEALFRGIRNIAPRLRVLHIDNVNPGTLAHHEKEAREITKIIIEYHTPGDVAALGVESADPRVIKLNNLKATPEESMKAIEILNEIGRRRGYNGLPELLPGVNFVAGLLGETKETYILNYEFLREVLARGLLLRRINIRQVLVFPHTRMWEVGIRIIARHKRYFHAFKKKVRENIDRIMLERVIPRYTVLKDVFTEAYKGEYTLARQVGAYPILVYIPYRIPLFRYIDVAVVDYGYRSITGLPTPLNINSAPRKVLEKVPGLGRSTVAEILSKRPLKRLKDLNGIETPIRLSLEDRFRF